MNDEAPLTTVGAMCAWCKGPLPTGARSDAITCSKRCRQARWRFRRQVSRLEDADTPKRLAIADPPYPGLSGYYRDHPDYAGEVDHASLLQRLDTYDGWALCTSADALPLIIRLATELAIDRWHVAAWIRGSRPTRSRKALSSWEPVLYRPARTVARVDQVDDSLVHVARPRHSDPARVIGAKPAAWVDWCFGLLQARAGDDLEDLFPGSGGIRRAWAAAHAGELRAGLDQHSGPRRL